MKIIELPVLVQETNKDSRNRTHNVLSSIRLKLALTRNDLLTSRIGTCQSKIKRGTELLFLSFICNKPHSIPNTKVKLIRILIFSPLKINGWYINLSSMDD